MVYFLFQTYEFLVNVGINADMLITLDLDNIEERKLLIMPVIVGTLKY